MALKRFVAEGEEMKYLKPWQVSFPWDQDIIDANQQVFGNPTFRECQQEIINATKSGRDCLALIPTGGGKSLTFQLSAVTDKGVTFVIMPLLSLIEDNINFVKDLGIPALSLSGGPNADRKMGELYNQIRDLHYKIVYLTPERLTKSPGLVAVMENCYGNGTVDRFVIDEVHCVSHWGQDFRKDYLLLDTLKKNFPRVPILGLTATATSKVKDDIIVKLGLGDDVVCFQSSFNRPNLNYEIRLKKNLKNVDQDLSDLLKTRFKDRSGIIYCVSRKNCENLAHTLKKKFKISCDHYHAEMKIEDRNAVQASWMKDEIQVIIATIAFGMGINKRDVRFVIHYSIPKSLEGYVQECGRGGRDGKRAECILYYTYSDRKLYDYFIVNNRFTNKARKNENLHALYSILKYCEEPYKCRRQLQLNFLGEDFDSAKCEQMCDNCKRDMDVQQRDMNKEAAMLATVIKQITEAKGNVTMSQIVDIVRGKKVQAKSIKNHIVELHKGCLKHLDEGEIRRTLLQMLTTKILKESFTSMQVGGRNTTVIVYLVPGRNCEDFVNRPGYEGHTKIHISEGKERLAQTKPKSHVKNSRLRYTS